VRSKKKPILIGLLLIVLAAGITWFEITFDPVSLIYYTAAWVVVVLLLLWIGNWLLTKLFNRLLSWHRFGNIRFFIHLFCGILYSLLVINGTYAALKYLLTIDPPTRSQIIVMNVYGAIFFIPAFSIYFSLHFLRSWRRSEVESERLQKESIRTQLESLKSHLDPHFLFNNLNILSSLIDKDKERSKVFLDKFADVYRLLLRSHTEDLVTMRTELDFIESYCFLIQTRFDQSIHFMISIPHAFYRLMLPPLTLQMLVENAIKHTLITEKKPLYIQITAGPDDTVEVTNTLNEKPPGTTTHSGSGLENIRMRYGYFTPKQIEVEKTEQTFKVTIPLIELQ
jgi:hypothetical protein